MSGRPRGGALAALSPVPAGSSPAPGVRCDLAFHTPGSPTSGWATHARLTPETVSALRCDGGLSIVIHKTGDLTAPGSRCGLFCRFALPPRLPLRLDDDYDDGAEAFVELALDSPVSLQVGGRGIIGRRVSLLSAGRTGEDEVLIAEGIVGFNHIALRG